jgi:hypothetical protein
MVDAASRKTRAAAGIAVFRNGDVERRRAPSNRDKRDIIIFGLPKTWPGQ